MPSYRIRHKKVELLARTEGDGAVLTGDPGEEFRIVRTGEATFQIVHDGGTVAAAAARVGDEWHIVMKGRLIEIGVESERDRLIRSLARSGVHTHSVLEVRAPMPSRIVAVHVGIGDRIVPGQPLIVLEAMKMENTLKANQEGVVSDIAVARGKAVEKGALLIVLK